jgi:hypothetical protein
MYDGHYDTRFYDPEVGVLVTRLSGVLCGLPSIADRFCSAMKSGLYSRL